LAIWRQAAPIDPPVFDSTCHARAGPPLAKRMVRYAHFRGIVKGGPVCVNENSGCLVEIKGVTVHFGAKMIFNDLSLEIRRGECLVLLGPSGIGKSTLLRLLIKTLNPERGSILFHGVDITHLPRTQLNRVQSTALVGNTAIATGGSYAFSYPKNQGIAIKYLVKP
jgi:ABC-type multidrug transport system fused ATPase/permease subunit